MECAEQLNDPTPKFNLFAQFRKDAELQKVITTARSLHSVGLDYFASDSPYIRTGETVEKEKAAKTFINLVIELDPQKSLTVRDSYTAFREYCVKNGLMLVERRFFEEIVGDLIERQYGLGLRNDVLNQTGKQQRGWLGLGMRQDQLVQLGIQQN